MQAMDVLEEIKRQRKLSDQVTAMGFKALREIYYPGVSPAQIRFGEIGSYGRGTNDDPEPDIDVMFLGIPGDARQGFFNWVGRGTAEMAQSPEGLTLLSQVHEYDPKLARAITETIKHVEGHFGCEKQATFNFVLQV